MSRYKPKTKEEIAEMSDKRIHNLYFWYEIIRHNDMRTWDRVMDEIERRKLNAHHREKKNLLV